MIMIRIDSSNGEQKLFNDYNDACSYLNDLEKRKNVEPVGKFWRFIRRKYETLSAIYYRTPFMKDFLTPKEKEAVEKRVGLIEIVKGNREHIIQFLVTDGLNLEPLKRDWCKEYCKAHGLKLLEFVHQP